MPNVIAAFSRVLAQAADMTLSEDGVLRDGEEVLLRLPGGSEGRVSVACHFAVMEKVRARRPDWAALMEAYAAAIQPDDLGALGLAFKTAPTLRGSLCRVSRYFRLVADNAIYQLEEEGGLARFIIIPQGAPHPTVAFRNEMALAGWAATLARMSGGRGRLSHVSFRHGPQADTTRYAEIFGCPVRFGAESDAIHMPSAMLDLDNRLGDRGVCDFLTAHLDEALGALPAAAPVKAEALRRLSSMLAEGTPPAALIARQMGMSERTLYRRLSAEGFAWRDVVQEAQKGLAQELLSRSDRSIAEIAFLTGFAEQSTFSRAFKRWFGQAPARYRATALGA